VALTNKIDAQDAAANLTKWLERQLPAGARPRVDDVHVPSASGLSTETVLFAATWTENGAEQRQRMVARVQPGDDGVFASYDLRKEADVMRALSDHTAVPAPKILFYEEDPAVLGAPFLVMAHVDGRVPSDDPPFTAAGWVLDLEPEQRRRMWSDSLRVLGDIHAADWRALGLGFLDTPEHASGLDAQIAHWERTFEWASQGRPNPTIEAALAHLKANRPADEGEKVLNWGDARVGNIIYADDLRPAAILDWEMVALASRELELGWWLFLARHHTEGVGLPLPEGIPDHAETLAEYERITGYRPVHMDYYEILAGTRLSILMVRAAQMLIDAGLLPADSTMAVNNPASQLLAKLLGHEAPTGDSTTFIGNRR
jgi:aminoglycoside phosphotransferase (APT) family kinase protein